MLHISPTDNEESVVEKIYVRRRRNPLLDRQAFHRRDQQEGETVDQYFSVLSDLHDA